MQVLLQIGVVRPAAQETKAWRKTVCSQLLPEGAPQRRPHLAAPGPVREQREWRERARAEWVLREDTGE